MASKLAFPDALKTFEKHYGYIIATAAATAATAALLYRLSRPTVMSTNSTFDFKKQAVEIEPGVFCSTLTPDGKPNCFLDPSVLTTHAAFCNGLKISNNGPFLGARTGPDLDYEWISYQTVYDWAQQFGSAMLSKGIAAGTDTNISIFANNCPQWVIADRAVAMYSMVTVALFSTYDAALCSYAIEKTEPALLLCDTAARAHTVLDGCRAVTHRMRCLVVVECSDVSDADRQLAEQLGIEVVSFDDMLALGKDNLRPPVLPSSSDVATICFTSGTTGNPKGVVLTHGSVIANITGVVQQSGFSELVPEDSYISFLPLSHMYERIVQCMLYQFGCQIGFFRGDIKLLMEDVAVLKPTVFSMVPRLLNRIYDKVLLGVHASRLKTMVFNFALSRKTALLESGVVTRDSIWDKLVFHKVQALLGGRVRFALIGSAPLSPTVLTFARCAFGCEVNEGYGQTEYAAGITFTMRGDTSSGHVGSVLSCSMLKVVDVPEMKYFAKDGFGEVCCRGPCQMVGYYKDPEETKKVIDDDGWLHTGDIGQIMPNGTLRIIDRKKHIFKLSRGEYVAPEVLEGIFTRSPLIAQIFVDGDTLQDLPVAIVVPDAEMMPLWAAKNGLPPTADMAALCEDEKLKEAILDDMKKLAKEAGLLTYEIPSAIGLLAEPFSIEGGLLTPTMKLRRPAARVALADRLAQLYK